MWSADIKMDRQNLQRKKQKVEEESPHSEKERRAEPPHMELPVFFLLIFLPAEPDTFVGNRQTEWTRKRRLSSGVWGPGERGNGHATRERDNKKRRQHRGITKLNIITRDLELETNIHTFRMSRCLRLPPYIHQSGSKWEIKIRDMCEMDSNF